MAPSRRKYISCCHHHAKVAPASLWPWSRITSMQFTVFPGQTVSSDSSSVLTDSTSTPELTTGINMIKSGKGKVDGDLETENSIHVLDFRDGTIHFFTNYNLDYLIRRCKPIPYFIPRIEAYQKNPGIVHVFVISGSHKYILRYKYKLHTCTLVNN